MKWIFVDDQENPTNPEDHIVEAFEDLQILLDSFREKYLNSLLEELGELE